MGVREIVALLVLLVLAGIAVGLLLNYQRNQRGRIKSRVKYRYDQPEPKIDDKAEYGSELPSGGARVVGYRDPDDIKTVHQRIRQQAEASRPKLSIFRDRKAATERQDPPVEPTSPPPSRRAIFQEKPQQRSLELDAEAEIPMLLDPAEMEPEIPLRALADADERDPLFMEKIRAEDHPSAVAELQRAKANKPAARSRQPEPEVDPQPALPVQVEPEPVAEPAHATESEPEAADEGPLEVLVLNLMASQGVMLGGAAIDQALRQEGLQFGQMDIYHYQPGPASRADFSVANILNPGTFTPDRLEEFATPGLCFFMTLSARGTNQDRFSNLLEIADRVAKQLGAKLHDEQRSVLTRQTIEHYRNRIRDFERRRMLR